MLQFLGLFSLPHGAQDDESTQQQCRDHYSKAGGFEQLHRAVAKLIDETELGEIHRDHQSAAEEHDHHDQTHHDLDHKRLYIGGSDSAELDAEERAGQDDHGEPDVDQSVHG